MGRRKTDPEKVEYARLLYVVEGLTLEEVAAKTGFNRKTISSWKDTDGWETRKASEIMSKRSQLNHLYAQINELNAAILNKEEGKRYANSKEADTLAKLTSSARNLETDTSIADIVNVSSEVLDFIKPLDFEAAMMLHGYFDQFIKSKLQ